MPGWHEKTKQAVADGKLLVLGIAPEQHGDRMALFLQWKQMEDMIVLLDSYGDLGLKSVPLTLLVDESGVIRQRNPTPESLQQFLQRAPVEVGSAPPAARPEARFTLMNPGDPDFMRQILYYDQGLRDLGRVGSESRRLAFQLGVALRKHYDTPNGTPEDFAKAVAYWKVALEHSPSNYIYRRRLQQYGPRLDKPYPFYDWIPQAREEITKRGATPHPLVAEPSGAELAKPWKPSAKVTKQDVPPHPDPANKLSQQEDGLFEHTIIYVPHTDRQTESFRVFVSLNPVTGKAKWNDEAGRSTLRLVPPPNWAVHPEVLTFRPTPESPADASRSVEFELWRTSSFDPFEEDRDGQPKLSLQMFIHTCFGTPEVCGFQRRDMSSEIQPWTE